MSVLLGWVIYAAIGALVLLIPPLVLGRHDYWNNLGKYLALVAFSLAGTAAIIGLIHLGMWAADLVSGK